MPTLTTWAHLPNASLIDALIAALPTCPSAAQVAALTAARDAAWNAARDAAWNAARDAAWNAAWVAAWYAARVAASTAGALVAWDDMPAFIALSDPELEALCKVGEGTDVSHKATFAQIYNILTAHAKP